MSNASYLTTKFYLTIIIFFSSHEVQFYNEPKFILKQQSYVKQLYFDKTFNEISKYI